MCIFCWLSHLFPHAVVHTAESGKDSRPPASAVEILKMRYARGELTREEYERMKRELS